MTNTKNEFLQKSEEKATDLEHKRKLSYNINQYLNTVKKGVQQFTDFDLAKKRAKMTKWRVMENLDQHLLEFETNFTKRGGKVLWAETAQEALKEIETIIKQNNSKLGVKVKSMATEEIELNHFLDGIGFEVHETDLGEYIQQLDGEKPYHIVTPAMHKSKEDVARVFNRELGTPLDLTPQEMTYVARKNLRSKYTSADIGFSGANFIIADTGSVCVTENEGNGRLCTSFPKIHIVIVGIEKIIPSINDLNLFWPLLSTKGTGQNVTVYNTIFSGPKQSDEFDGPEQMFVILLDNGRSKLLAETSHREALYCIRCGACLNACPIYKNIGGHAYGTTYSGPVGSVISPHYEGMEAFQHLSNASTLCGNCTEVCPVNINLHNMLLQNRVKAVENGFGSNTETLGWTLWRKAMLDRQWMDFGGSTLKHVAVNYIIGTKWTKQRGSVHIAKQSFKDWWLKDKLNVK